MLTARNRSQAQRHLFEFREFDDARVVHHDVDLSVEEVDRSEDGRFKRAVIPKVGLASFPRAPSCLNLGHDGVQLARGPGGNRHHGSLAREAQRYRASNASGSASNKDPNGVAHVGSVASRLLGGPESLDRLRRSRVS